MHFDRFAFDERIRAGIRTANYKTPTPIQDKAIPEVLKGSDVLGLAQTGTGKTAAFALPLLQRLVEVNAAKQGPIRVLVLAPTRELALQIHESFMALGRQTGIRSAVVYGGVGKFPQVKALRRATICVACPGRLLDLMSEGQVNLSQVSALVVDEADRMLDMGFIHDVKRIVGALPAKRQNLLFSATMPEDITDLCESMLNNPSRIEVANTVPVKSVEQQFYPVAQHLKAKLLMSLLGSTEHESVLIFTRTKFRAKSLAQKLERQGFSATSLQGNMSQNKRQEALKGFKNGRYRIMVATDIAARGIDCACISHVINFDIPDTGEAYTHRIGRTGRANRSGVAMTLVSREDASMMRAIERIQKRRIEHTTLDGFDYDARRPDTGKHPGGTNPPRQNASGPARAGRSRYKGSGRRGGNASQSRGGSRHATA